jgi:hypothetical protein
MLSATAIVVVHVIVWDAVAAHACGIQARNAGLRHGNRILPQDRHRDGRSSDEGVENQGLFARLY